MWIVLIYRCNEYRINASKIDTEEEETIIRESVARHIDQFERAIFLPSDAEDEDCL